MLGRYLREASNIETAFPVLHGVHGTAAYAFRGLLVAGFGGEIIDDPRRPRDERDRLSYPSWEVEYRLKVLREFDYNELVLLFWTAPADKGLQRPGSDGLAELIGTYRPHLVVCGGDRGSEAGRRRNSLIRPLRQRLRSAFSALSLARMYALATRSPGGRTGRG